MKTAVLGRTAEHEPIWNPAYQKLAVECKFHPDVCAPASGNQKGAVENLVKFVKGNLLPGRSFYDDADDRTGVDGAYSPEPHGAVRRR
jgi:transposase